MSTDTVARGDLDALLALNSDYIHSVQHGDVRRFDEILAEDFLCSNPDGSLVDKSAFLAQIARPVTISGLTAQDVQVRILGDVAIIHACTSYATADGKARNAVLWFGERGGGAADPVTDSVHRRRRPTATSPPTDRPNARAPSFAPNLNLRTRIR